MRPPEPLRRLLLAAEHTPFPTWSAPRVAFCRCDPNILNLVRRPAGWISVDWENSGWGDPAFEIADLMTHPAYLSVPEERWEWVTKLYCRLTDDPTASERIPTYRALMLVWWAAYFARIHHELTHGLARGRRLSERPAAWGAAAGKRYELYLERAKEALSRF